VRFVETFDYAEMAAVLGPGSPRRDEGGS
jgi:hypothetical protein